MKYINGPLSLILSLTAMTAISEELQPVVIGKQLGVVVTGIQWPATLHKDFQSGFENRILVRLALISEKSPVMQSDVLIIEKYDLWTEVFNVVSLVDNKQKAIERFANVNDAFSYATTLRLTNIFTTSEASQNRAMTLQADILINPIEREKIEKVTQWVAENSAPKTSGPAGINAPLTSKPNTLFNSIYGQYVRGADIAAPWKVRITSKPFVMTTDKNDTHNNEGK